MATKKDGDQATRRELFGRLVFNILCKNTDDHALNRAAVWDGKHLKLTPAYDICPQNRTGNEATQAMLITGEDRRSRLATCLTATPHFQLSAEAAKKLIADHLKRLFDAWAQVAKEARLSEIDHHLLCGHIFLNPSIFEDAPARFVSARLQ